MSRRLEMLAYRFLGTVDDAEDVVQEARLRMLGLERQPENAEAYLTRTVANLAVDRLRHMKVERRAYPGPWLPEPMLTAGDTTEQSAIAGEDLSFGFLLMLERLSASERVVFVLREALGSRFDEIAAMLDISAAAARQRYHRARRKLADERSVVTPAKEQKALLERLVALLAAGDAPGLVALLSQDALLLTDGGGRVSAAVQPVAGRERIARVLVHLAGRQDLAGLTMSFLPVNGGEALVLRRAGRPEACVALEAREGLVRRLYVVRNPRKLAPLLARRGVGGR